MSNRQKKKESEEQKGMTFRTQTSTLTRIQNTNNILIALNEWIKSSQNETAMMQKIEVAKNKTTIRWNIEKIRQARERESVKLSHTKWLQGVYFRLWWPRSKRLSDAVTNQNVRTTRMMLATTRTRKRWWETEIERRNYFKTRFNSRWSVNINANEEKLETELEIYQPKFD